MNKTKSLIFFEELLLEIWHKLRWYSSGVVLAVITVLGVFAGFYTAYHFIFYAAVPLIENLVHWLKTENSLYVGGSMDLFPTVDVYFESVWGIDIFNKWEGLRSLLGWIPFVSIPARRCQRLLFGFLNSLFWAAAFLALWFMCGQHPLGFSW